MNRLRNRLVLAFVVATLVPFSATLWIAASLLDRSLAFATTKELDELSRTLEQTAREYYQQARESLRSDAVGGRAPVARYAIAETATLPAPVAEFVQGAEQERFTLSGSGGGRLDYLLRHGDEVWVYSRALGTVQMTQITDQYRRAREVVALAQGRDLRRGLNITLVVLAAGVWLFGLLSLVYLAHRISGPIQRLTGGLSELASGNLNVRLAAGGRDETGRAIDAFNHMATQLQQSRTRLVYLTQIASWQLMARKMAHELKNSLTPIRLTVEEIAARRSRSEGRDEFMQQAVQIVVEEIETLERRVRAFSEFSGEPKSEPSVLDINAVVEERISFLKPCHATTVYKTRYAEQRPSVFADPDQVKGILTNLLENAADAAGNGGEVLAITTLDGGKVCVEIHDSGPGISEDVRRTLFEPAITFKKHGMGLGLSIARKNALVNGGDIMLTTSELGGAAFCLVLPAYDV